MMNDRQAPSSLIGSTSTIGLSAPTGIRLWHSHNHARASRPSLTPQHSQLTRLPSQLPQEPTSHTTNLSQTTPGSLDSASTSAMSPASRTKRRQMAGGASGPDATRRIVVANFSNEVDALEILATAATDEDKANAGRAARKATGWPREWARAETCLLESRRGTELGRVCACQTRDHRRIDFVGPCPGLFVHFHPFLVSQAARRSWTQNAQLTM